MDKLFYEQEMLGKYLRKNMYKLKKNYYPLMG